MARITGRTWHAIAFDAAGQAVATINALGNRFTTVFDAAGRAKASINPLGNRSTSVFDAASQPVELRRSAHAAPEQVRQLILVIFRYRQGQEQNERPWYIGLDPYT